jgi:hypothetical protein
VDCLRADLHRQSGSDAVAEPGTVEIDVVSRHPGIGEYSNRVSEMTADQKEGELKMLRKLLQNRRASVEAQNPPAMGASKPAT